MPIKYEKIKTPSGVIVERPRVCTMEHMEKIYFLGNAIGLSKRRTWEILEIRYGIHYRAKDGQYLLIYEQAEDAILRLENKLKMQITLQIFRAILICMFDPDEDFTWEEAMERAK